VADHIYKKVELVGSWPQGIEQVPVMSFLYYTQVLILPAYRFVLVSLAWH